MLLPRGDEYNSAIQNPRIAFADPDLKHSQVEITPLGLPKPYSGGFTITYKLSSTHHGWAVRCFHRDIQDLQKRYQALGSFFAKNKSSYFIDAKFLPDGIRVDGKGYPIIKMLWLEGDPLNSYLNKFYAQKEKVDALRSDFKKLINELEVFGIAHGDLQHGNIIVRNNKLHLIDYDGMYFPELSSLRSNEIGHVNYQHPKRSASHYNQYIDRFSAIVIYLGLTAIGLKAALWKKYDNSENLLFKSQDFADLENSDLIKDLLAIPELKVLTERLIGCCHLEFSEIPSLNDFLLGNFFYDKNAAGKISITRSQYEIISASRSGSLLEHFGEKIEVVGKISGKYVGETVYGAPFMFLNFGMFPNQTFTLVIWSEGISALTSNGLSPNMLVGKWVSVTGVITSYGSKPQMIVELSSQIQLLSGEGEADQRLKIKPVVQQSGIKNPQATAKKIDREADFFNTFYKDRPVSIADPTPATQPATKQASSSKVKSPVSQPVKQHTITPTVKRNNTSDNNGCIIPLVCAFIGALLFAAGSGGKFWFAGVVVGGFVGFWLSNVFKS